MGKLRVLIFLMTMVIVGVGVYFASLYARGYRFNRETFDFSPSGLLVLKSNPEGAIIEIDGEIQGATNSNLTLPPGTYKVVVRKEGYQSWQKDLTVFKEVVTEADAHLFKTAPSLSAMTLNNVFNPLPSYDFTKIAYAVSDTEENIKSEKDGLWILETVNLPLGFAKDPRRITNGDFSQATFLFSPDGRQILVTNKLGSYLLDTSTYTPQSDWVAVTTRKDEILTDWKDEQEKRLASQLRGLPENLVDVLKNKSEHVFFSPDETKILYLVKEDASLPNDLIKPVPGSSTQKEERALKNGRVYVYDIKEDRNFYISSVDGETKDCKIQSSLIQLNCAKIVTWFPTSRHLVETDEEKVTVMDYDGLNRQSVYTGSFVAPYAFPSISDDRIIILTNLGSNSDNSNLYSVSIK